MTEYNPIMSTYTAEKSDQDTLRDALELRRFYQVIYDTYVKLRPVAIKLQSNTDGAYQYANNRHTSFMQSFRQCVDNVVGWMRLHSVRVNNPILRREMALIAENLDILYSREISRNFEAYTNLRDISEDLTAEIVASFDKLASMVKPAIDAPSPSDTVAGMQAEPATRRGQSPHPGFARIPKPIIVDDATKPTEPAEKPRRARKPRAPKDAVPESSGSS